MPALVLAAAEFTPDPAALARWREALPPARRRVLDALDDPQARIRSLLGTRLLQAGLQRLGQPHDALQGLHYPLQGKPRLAVPLSFSIAHCQGCVLCALADDGPIGIDVEALGPLRASSFHRYLSETERRWAGDDAERFHIVWTRKEAIVKAADSAGLRELADVHLDDEGRARWRGRVWYTRRLAVGAGFVAHIARDRPVSPPFVERLSEETLL